MRIARQGHTGKFRSGRTRQQSVQSKRRSHGHFSAGATYRVIVKGDYIRDKSKKRAIDADNLPAFWALGGKTGDRIEGGTFESWFLTG